MPKAHDMNFVRTLIETDISKDAAILDFGCGTGSSVYKLIDQGYLNVFGYDVQDYLNLKDAADRSRFRIAQPANLRLPFDDNTFDLIISDQVFEHVQDQVTAFRELYRVTKPGGYQFHIIPAPYYPLERHMRVPLGNLFPHRWWYVVWAQLGIRNDLQRGLNAVETANQNAVYIIGGLNYVTTSCYKALWQMLGFEYRFTEQTFFDSHRSELIRAIGKANSIVPFFGWLYRTFKNRQVLLRKLPVP
jgi:SAM-dependent methyltransferase